jgi:dynein heavy chain
LILAVKILFGDNAMDPDEWRYFLAGPAGSVEPPKNPTDWLGDLEWNEVYKNFHGMSKLPKLKGIEKTLVTHHREFQKIFDSNEPQNLPLPGDWNDKLDYFQVMIVIKSIRPDKVPLAIQNFVTKKIGKQFIEPPTFSLAKSFKDSNFITPLIFVLSPGSDPVADFQRFSEEMGMKSKYQAISLGRGQDKKAENCINDNISRGGWALLMNCHLASSFMPKLEAIVENLENAQPHRDFRLWMTSMPAKTFPVSVLQNSVKMTLEPPSGLKQNVLGTYEALDWKEIEESEKPEPIKKLLFGFCFFHAIVQDRRKFGPIGWNIPYAFTNEDLMVCRKQLKIFVQDYDEVPYKVLNYVGSEVNYGGRVTDDKDVRLIQTILKTYINANILNDGHKFSPSGIYYTIPAGEKEDYIEYIKTLPLNPDPEAFGLHDNAEITTSQNNTINLLQDVLSMQPRASGGSGKSREEIIGEMAADLERQTPPVFNLEAVSKAYPTKYEESMNTVLFQECVRYNAVLKEMAVSLKQVQKALVGEVVMSEDLEAMANAIFDNNVPPMWAKKGFLSLKPLGSWIIECNERIEFLNNWIKNGTPKVFWISGFFFPQAFLTGTL